MKKRKHKNNKYNISNEKKYNKQRKLKQNTYKKSKKRRNFLKI